MPPSEIPSDVYETAAVTLASIPTPSKHGQLCPVWTKRASNPPATECNCWILRNAQFDSRFVVNEIWPLVRAQVAAEIRAVDVQRIADLEGDTARVGLTVAARIAEGGTEHGS